MRYSIVAVAAFLGAALTLHADELVFKDGTVLSCQIYKDAESEIRFIDPATAQCSVAAKSDLKQIVFEEKPLVDLKAFLQKEAEHLSAQEKSDLEAAIKDQSAEGGKAPAARAEKPATKTKFRTLSQGVSVKTSAGTHAQELTVEAFPEGRPPGKASQDSKSGKEENPPDKKDPPNK